MVDQGEQLTESGLRTPKSVHFPRDRQDPNRVTETSEEGAVGLSSGIVIPNRSIRFYAYPEVSQGETFVDAASAHGPDGGSESPVEVQQKVGRSPAAQ